MNALSKEQRGQLALIAIGALAVIAALWMGPASWLGDKLARPGRGWAR